MVQWGSPGADFRLYVGEAESPRAPVPSETLVEAGVCAGGCLCLTEMHVGTALLHAFDASSEDTL